MAGTLPTAAYVLLLRRHTTPLVSASWRTSAVATPPTPPVLQVTALAGSGPGGQLAEVRQTLPLMLHVPLGEQVALLVHDAPPTWQVPAIVGQPALEVQMVPVWTLQ